MSGEPLSGLVEDGGGAAGRESAIEPALDLGFVGAGDDTGTEVVDKPR